MQHKLFCLMGPTASGKTALACELVQQFPFEIISVDSAMIYREMDIGTAKPTQAELLAFPHHLINVLDPPQSFSAAAFCSDVKDLCANILKRNKIPLLVGGTMMYFHALQQGLSSLPEANEKVRSDLIKQANELGWEAMHTQLAQVDPQTALKIHAHDTQRIQRALEVFQLTGKPLSTFLNESKKILPYTFVNYILFPNNRAWLHARIAARFELMLQQGFVNEVETLTEKWQLSLTCPAMRCVGYRQAYEYLLGNDNYEAFCNKALAATRQLAKRQLTWLRHWPEGTIFACDEPLSCNKSRITKSISDRIN